MNQARADARCCVAQLHQPLTNNGRCRFRPIDVVLAQAVNRKLIQMIVWADQRLLHLEGTLYRRLDRYRRRAEAIRVEKGAEMKTANSKLLTGRHALMLAVAMAPFAAAGQAQAACSP